MNFSNFDRIEYLNSILPYVKEYSGSIFVIKYGGSAMEDLSSISNVINDILFLYYLGIKPVIIHGGGPLINNWLKKLNIEPQFLDGLRITDDKTMEVVQMVLCGHVNKNLVSLFNSNGNLAVGLSGQDSNLIQCESKFHTLNNYIGKVTCINSHIINLLLSNNYIPIIASVGLDKNGQSYNINADTVAGEIAISLKANKLILLTDAPGIMGDINKYSTLIKILKVDELFKLKEKKVISGGMIPKVESCINALNHHVNSAHIIDGRLSHSLLYEIFTQDRSGSMITV
uniref:Acetylglutamate kinase n=1 Tax=Compsothamnion thuioides TaxID=3097386 RepID=A0A4D6WPD0_9FLOR|nr:acetylglutamate kinase [Compsothamnion thuyoides]